MPLIPANGSTLHVVTLGDGSPVVMLHGLLLGSLAQWYFTAAPVLARDHRVILTDLRGHGRSERACDGYDLATLGADVEGVLEALDERAPVDLVGHSYGALVALTFALRHPARVRRLVLIDAPLPPGQADVFSEVSASPESLLAALPAPVRAGLLDGRRRARRLLASLDFLAHHTTLLADVAREPDLDDDALAALTAPTLCVYGASSACLPAGRRLARVLPAARLEIVDGGHFLPVESPAALTAAIARHLAIPMDPDEAGQ